jgi:hypothetical protein
MATQGCQKSVAVRKLPQALRSGLLYKHLVHAVTVADSHFVGFADIAQPTTFFVGPDGQSSLFDLTVWRAG